MTCASSDPTVIMAITGCTESRACVRDRQLAGMDCTEQTPDRVHELSGPAGLQESNEKLLALVPESVVVDFDAVSALGCASLRNDAGFFNIGMRNEFGGIREGDGILVCGLGQ